MIAYVDSAVTLLFHAIGLGEFLYKSYFLSLSKDELGLVRASSWSAKPLESWEAEARDLETWRYEDLSVTRQRRSPLGWLSIWLQVDSVQAVRRINFNQAAVDVGDELLKRIERG